jgi:hypothetical protein
MVKKCYANKQPLCETMRSALNQKVCEKLKVGEHGEKGECLHLLLSDIKVSVDGPRVDLESDTGCRPD